MTKKWLLTILALALVGAVPLQITPTPARAQDRDDAKTLDVDVAIDGATLSLNNNDPANPANPIRGTTFTVIGKIFPEAPFPRASLRLTRTNLAASGPGCAAEFLLQMAPTYSEEKQTSLFTPAKFLCFQMVRISCSRKAKKALWG